MEKITEESSRAVFAGSTVDQRHVSWLGLVNDTCSQPCSRVKAFRSSGRRRYCCHHHNHHRRDFARGIGRERDGILI